MVNFRTDLATERKDIYQKANNLSQIEGIKTFKKEIDEKIKVEKVEITNQKGEASIGKPIGQYITMDIKDLKLAMEDEIETASRALCDELREVVSSHIDKEGEVLVVGLGNIYVTPDALRAQSNKSN